MRFVLSKGYVRYQNGRRKMQICCTKKLLESISVDCTGFAGHVEKTYNEVKGRVRNYEREQISQKV